MSSQQQRFERVYPAPADALYAAFREALASGKYRKVAPDDFTKAATFETKSLYRYPFTCQGQVTTDDDGSRLALTAASKGGGLLAPSGAKRATELMGALMADISSRCAKLVA